MAKNNGILNSYHGDTSDFPIIDRALIGEQAAYEELFGKYRQRIFMFFMRSTRGSLADSEDLVQNTFLLAFSKLSTFKKKAGFYTWLHRIAVNVFLMSCRRKKPSFILIDDLHSQQIANGKLSVGVVSDNRTWTVKKSDIGGHDYMLENVPNKILVAQLTQNLPPGYKKILELHDLLGFGYKEVAAKLGRSVGNAKSQRHGAIEKLRKEAQIAHT